MPGYESTTRIMRLFVETFSASMSARSTLPLEPRESALPCDTPTAAHPPTSEITTHVATNTPCVRSRCNVCMCVCIRVCVCVWMYLSIQGWIASREPGLDPVSLERPLDSALDWDPRDCRTDPAATCTPQDM